MSDAAIMIWLALPLMWLLVSGVLLAIHHRRLLLAWWREPVLRRPVLIFESDDWGPGDASHARALQKLAAVLAAYRDSDGRHPVTTLGIVLALADTARIRETDITAYFRTSLAEYPALLDVMRLGAERGVFALQLHGLEHYWAPSLLALAGYDPHIKSWLTASALPRTEALPAALQSRWIDAVNLPSRPLPEDEIETAVSEEVAMFRAVFHAVPTVVVPPTFVWTPAVERAWVRHGVRYLVTPGRRYGARDEQGRPVAEGEPLVNGAHGAAGVMYLVRDDYFEPARGHSAARGLQALKVKTQLGRPTLLEMHRFNFIDDPAVAERAYREMEILLGSVLAAYPAVAFLSSAELGRCLETRDPLWVEQGRRRLGIWAARVHAHHGVWRWSRFTGLGVMVWVLRTFFMRDAKRREDMP